MSGHPGEHYCPRMAAMNKPTYRAILKYSPDRPTLVFVSSRRQTRLTALDLIAYCSVRPHNNTAIDADDDIAHQYYAPQADEREQQFLKISAAEIEPYLATIRDPSLRHTLAFGIGIHHAGLAETDRNTVEKLFVEQARDRARSLEIARARSRSRDMVRDGVRSRKMARYFRRPWLSSRSICSCARRHLRGGSTSRRTSSSSRAQVRDHAEIAPRCSPPTRVYLGCGSQSISTPR